MIREVKMSYIKMPVCSIILLLLFDTPRGEYHVI